MLREGFRDRVNNVNKQYLSFTTMATPDLSAREAVEAASRYGYNGIDLRISDYKGEIQIESKDSDIREIREVLNTENIQLAGVLCYNKVGGEDDASWQEMEESIIRHIELGIKLGSPSIRIFGGDPHTKIPFEDYVKYSSDVIGSVLEKVEENIEIVIQNHGNSYGALECIELIKKVNNPRFGLVFSPDHSLMMGENLKKVFSAVKPYTKQLYVSDVILSAEKNKERDYRGILPGKGLVALEEACHAIGGDDFEGFVSFKWEKIWQENLEEPEIALPWFIDYWRKIGK